MPMEWDIEKDALRHSLLPSTRSWLRCEWLMEMTMAVAMRLRGLTGVELAIEVAAVAAVAVAALELECRMADGIVLTQQCADLHAQCVAGADWTINHLDMRRESAHPASDGPDMQVM